MSSKSADPKNKLIATRSDLVALGFSEAEIDDAIALGKLTPRKIRSDGKGVQKFNMRQVTAVLDELFGLTPASGAGPAGAPGASDADHQWETALAG